MCDAVRVAFHHASHMLLVSLQLWAMTLHLQKKDFLFWRVIAHLGSQLPIYIYIYVRASLYRINGSDTQIVYYQYVPIYKDLYITYYCTDGPYILGHSSIFHY